MELRSLLQILAARWWLVVPVFVMTVGASLVFGLSQKPVFEATTRLEVTPSATLPNEILSVLNVVARQSEIVDTYAQIASSKRVEGAAADALKLTGDQRHDVKMVGRLVTGTTLLDLTASAGDRNLARDYANAVASQLVTYVKGSSPILQVSVVDEAGTPDRPVSPNVPLDVGLGAAVGLLLGLGLAIVVHLLNPPPKGGLRDVVDPETWAFNGAFLAYRLRQEMSRGSRSHQPVSVALIDVNHQGALNDLLPRQRLEALRRIVPLIDGHLRSEDVSARLDGTVFGVLLPDTSEEQALPLVEALRARISAPALASVGDGAAVHANTAAGVVEFREGALTDGDVIQEARMALQAAQTGPVGRTEAFSWLRSSQAGVAMAPMAASAAAIQSGEAASTGAPRPLSLPAAPPPTAALTAPPTPAPTAALTPAPTAAPTHVPTALPTPGLPPGHVTSLNAPPTSTASGLPAPPSASPAARSSAVASLNAATPRKTSAVAPVQAGTPSPPASSAPGPQLTPPSFAAPAPAPVSAAGEPASTPPPEGTAAPNAAVEPPPRVAAALARANAATKPQPTVPEPSPLKPAKGSGTKAPSSRPSRDSAPDKGKSTGGHRGSGKRQVRRAR